MGSFAGQHLFDSGPHSLLPGPWQRCTQRRGFAGLDGEILLDLGLRSRQLTQAGRLQAYGISTRKRSMLAPDIPTVAESGLAGFEGGAWYGLVVPTNTPPAIIAKLAKDNIAILRQPDVHERLSQQGVEAIGSQPAEFAQFIKTEISKFARVVAISGARFD